MDETSRSKTENKKATSDMQIGHDKITQVKNGRSRPQGPSGSATGNCPQISQFKKY